jgi:tetratricopeptide (TPR) repeat protein
MKKIFSKFTVIALSTVMFIGCESVLEPVNPNLSEDAIVGQPNSSQLWLNGLERQLAIMLNRNLVLSELASDNYKNTQTFFNQFMDNLAIDYQDNDINRSQWMIARLREMAVFGLERVAPNDPTADQLITAEFHFFKGLSHLYSAMYYKALPAVPSGPILSRIAHMDNAIASFDQALALDPTHVASMLGKARANYLKGDADAALAAANDAINADANFLRVAEFDDLNSGAQAGLNYTSNDIQDALFDRGTFDDLQPLPSLDFLDPKFSLVAAGVESSVPILKIEEAYLIKAEAEQSKGNDAGAISAITDMFTVVAGREVRSINDAIEDRDQDNPGSRPDSTDITVDGRSGLVLYRKGGNVDIPSVSGTSFTAADLAGLAGDDLLEMIYRIRQEVFIGEGIRSVDMGITLVLSENEFLLNDNATSGDITADIPPYLIPLKEQIDAFDYDPVTRVCTITNDFNEIIVANKTSEYVCPFH